jgi:3-hydroxyacyl-CoA dehydrogenase
MGGGIAMNFLNAGVPVTILEKTQEALDRGVATIKRNYEATVKRGKLTAEKMAERMALLKPTVSYDDIKDADLVIEAVFEQMDVKETVFRKIDEVARAGAILATNTSTLDVNHIADVTKRPQDVVGMHFFSPANVMKLLEVIRGAKTAKDVLATVMQVAKKIRKTAVVSGVCDGFIGNRMVEHYLRQAMFLVEEGASPAQVDAALEKFGMAMGPFRMSDLAGNDIGWAIRKRRYVEKPDMVYSKIADRLCEMGRFGQKTGKGWYRYEKGDRTPIVDPETHRIIKEVAAEKGFEQRTFTDEEILRRLLFSSVNEACKILEEGKAIRASDIDVMWLNGFGFPRYRGGLMYWADGIGVGEVYRQIQAWHQQYGERWAPSALLRRLAETGTPLREAKPGRPM